MFRNWNHDAVTDRTSFEIHDVDLAIVNGLRRTIISEVPTLAFRGEPMEKATIDIHKNTGPLHNDFMVHRIGLLPIHFTTDEIDMEASPEKVFHLQKKNTTESTIDVTSHDIKIEGEGMSNEHLRLFPANKITKSPILITRLRKGEELEFTAKVVKSNGKELASFSPVSMCTLSYIEDKARITKDMGILDKERAFVRNEYGEPTSFLFSLESENGLPTKYIVDKALEILYSKIAMVIAEVNNADSTKVTIKPIDIPKNSTVSTDDSGAPIVSGIEFTFNDEDDTLGNLLQSLIHNEHVRPAAKKEADNTASGGVGADVMILDMDSVPIKYVGYLCPHPLEPRMVLSIRGKPSQATVFINALVASCHAINQVLDGVRTSWSAFAK